MVTGIIDSIPLAIETIERTTLDKVSLIQFQNNHRHILIETERGLKYWVLYKNDFLNQFGMMFNLSGVGESINKDILEKAIFINISTLLFIHNIGTVAEVYAISPNEVKLFAELNNTIRETASKEITYSIPVSFLRKI